MPNSVQALLETQWKCAVPECIQNGGTAHLIVFGLITGPLMWSINPHDTNHANDLARVTDIFKSSVSSRSVCGLALCTKY